MNESNESANHYIFNSSALAFNVILSLIFTFGLVLNIISISSIVTARAFTPINILIINLAMADITYTLGIPFFMFQMFNYKWPFGVFGCKLFIFTEFSGIIVGVLSVAALSVERFSDVADNNKRLESLSKNLKLLIIKIYSILAWVFAVCFSLPLLFSIKLVRHGESLSCQSDWQDSSLRLFFMAKLIAVFILPYLVISVSSVKLLIFLNNWKKRFNHSALTNRRYKSRKVTFNLSKNETISECQVEKAKVKRLEEKKESLSINESILSPNKKRSSMQSYSAILKPLPIILFDFSSETELKSSLIELQESKNKYSDFLFCFRNKFFKKKIDQHLLKTSGQHVNSIRRKAVRMVLVIILLFLIQWTPFWIFQIFNLFSTAKIEYIQLINMIVSTLSYSNTVANPVLYMLLTYNFKEYVKSGCLKAPLENFCFQGNKKRSR